MTFYSRLERTPARMCKDGRRALLTWMITFFVNLIISSVKLEMRSMGLQIIVQSSWRWTLRIVISPCYLTRTPLSKIP